MRSEFEPRRCGESLSTEQEIMPNHQPRRSAPHNDALGIMRVMPSTA